MANFLDNIGGVVGGAVAVQGVKQGLLSLLTPGQKDTLANLPINLFKGLKRGFGVNDSKYSLTFDLILDESYSFSNTVTKHPVQNGAIITDHVQNMLRSCAFTGLVSNYSLKSPFLDRNRAQDAYDTLKTIWKNKELVTISIGLEILENWLISDLSTARSSKDGESLSFTINFTEARIVKLRQVNVGVQVESWANKETKVGDKQVTEEQTLVSADDLFKQVDEVVPSSSSGRYAPDTPIVTGFTVDAEGNPVYITKRADKVMTNLAYREPSQVSIESSVPEESIDVLLDNMSEEYKRK